MKNIAIVVDMQNGFARYEQTINLTEKISNLLKKNLFDYVVATRFLNADQSIYENLLDWKRLKTEGERKIADGIIEYVDVVFDKYIYNCVTPSFIQKLCQLNEGVCPEKVFVFGADTDCCVLITSTALFENNIRPVVLTKYCDSNGGPDAHRAGLACMRRLIGSRQLVDVEINCKDDIENI